MGNTNLRDAIFLAKEGRKTEARWLLEQILQADRSNELAWLWYAECAESAQERTAALETCLRSNPNAARARANLAVLRGEQPGAFRPPELEETAGPTQPVRVRPGWARSIPEESAAGKPAGDAHTEAGPGDEPLVAVTGLAPAVQMPFAAEPPRLAAHAVDEQSIERELEALQALMAEREKASQEMAAPEATDPFASEPALLDALSQARSSEPEPQDVVPPKVAQPPVAEPTVANAPQEMAPAPIFAGEKEVLDALARIQAEQEDSVEPARAKHAHSGAGLFEDPFLEEAAPGGLVADPFGEEKSLAGLFLPEDSIGESELSLMDAIAPREQPSVFAETPAFTVPPDEVSEDEFDHIAQRAESNLVQQGGPQRPPARRARASMRDIDWSELEQMGEPRVHVRRAAPEKGKAREEEALPDRPAQKKEPREHPYIRLLPADRDPSTIFAILVVSVVVLLVAMSLGVLIALW